MITTLGIPACAVTANEIKTAKDKGITLILILLKKINVELIGNNDHFHNRCRAGIPYQPNNRLYFLLSNWFSQKQV
jgi:hypothetical protein